MKTKILEICISVPLMPSCQTRFSGCKWESNPPRSSTHVVEPAVLNECCVIALEKCIFRNG